LEEIMVMNICLNL